MRYCYLHKRWQRSLRIRFTSGSLYYATNDNCVSNCAIDRHQDLINYANFAPVLRVTLHILYRTYYVIDKLDSGLVRCYFARLQ